jgi:hypothetical protein
VSKDIQREMDYTKNEQEAQRKYWRDQYYKNRQIRIAVVRKWQDNNKKKVAGYKKRYAIKKRLRDKGQIK